MVCRLNLCEHYIVSDILYLLYLLLYLCLIFAIVVASFYTVYNLALSSKHFFGDIPASDEIERGAICQVDGLQSGKIRLHMI